MKAILAALAVILSLMPAYAADLMIALDLSDSMPIVVEERVAKRASSTIANKIHKMDRGDTIMIRSFGFAGASEQQINENLKITGRRNPARAAKQVGGFIAALPNLVRDGKINVETQTNITGWLEMVGPTICPDGTTILVMSDAIEWSANVTGKDLIQGADLPEPSYSFLEGCKVEFWGVGQQIRKFGTDPAWYPTLRKAWSKYMELAGASDFRAYGVYSR